MVGTRFPLPVFIALVGANNQHLLGNKAVVLNFQRHLKWQMQGTNWT